MSKRTAGDRYIDEQIGRQRDREIEIEIEREREREREREKLKKNQAKNGYLPHSIPKPRHNMRV